MALRRESSGFSSLRDKAFLAPGNYDDDASSIHSERSEQDSDSEDDEVLMGARSSADLRAHDRGVLDEEEEMDRLVEKEQRRKQRRGSALANVAAPLRGLFSKSFSELPGVGGDGEEEEKSGKRKRRRQRRGRKNDRLMGEALHGEDGVLMHEMEEGGMKEGSSTGESSETEISDDLDRRGLRGLYQDKARRKRSWRWWCFLHLLISVGFSILVLLAWKLSLKRHGAVTSQAILSNGSALFAPTTILISLDGFRADFLNRGLTPRLNAFVAEGVSPIYMNPSFPSVTFPNHHTIATGLYPEAHGVVGNTFWDPELKEEFYYTHPNAMQPQWWGGEPLWVTAETQGVRTAIHMWPGSEAHIAGVEPAFMDKYNGKESLPNKVNSILGWLDKPGAESGLPAVAELRPQLIAAYVPNVDADGHLHGPNSTEIRSTIQDVDNMLDSLFRGLEARNLTTVVNVVVVSDHGMATTDVNRLIQLEDIIDTSLIEHTDGWPLYGLRPKDPAHLQSIYDTLAKESSSNPNFEVYLRDENMPERYHFSKNQRIAPIWIVPKTGWAIVTKDEMDVKEAKQQGLVYHPKGLHGYDHEHPLMRAIFVARGPAFPHKPNSRVDPFQNIEVYNIICDSLNLTPAPNNGTLRLPLKPVGVHSQESSPPEHPDPELNPSTSVVVESASSAIPGTPTASDAGLDAIMSISPIEASSAADPDGKSSGMIGIDKPAEADLPATNDESKLTEEQKGWIQWAKAQLEKMKTWFGKVTASQKGDEGEKANV